MGPSIRTDWTGASAMSVSILVAAISRQALPTYLPRARLCTAVDAKGGEWRTGDGMAHGAKEGPKVLFFGLPYLGAYSRRFRFAGRDRHPGSLEQCAGGSDCRPYHGGSWWIKTSA